MLMIFPGRGDHKYFKNLFSFPLITWNCLSDPCVTLKSSSFFFRLVYGADGLAQRELNKRPTTWVEGTKQGDNVMWLHDFILIN